MKLTKKFKRFTIVAFLGVILASTFITPVYAAVGDESGGSRTAGEGFFTGRGIVWKDTAIDSQEKCEQYDQELTKLKEESDKASKNILDAGLEDKGFTANIMAPVSQWFVDVGSGATENVILLSTSNDCESGFHIGVWLHTLATGIDLTGNETFMDFLRYVAFFGFVIAGVSFVQKALVLFFLGGLRNASDVVPLMMTFVLTLVLVHQFPYLVQDVVNITSFGIDGLMGSKVGFDLPKGGA